MALKISIAKEITVILCAIKKLKHIISILVWALAGLYFAGIVLLHVPAVQTAIGSEIAGALAKKFGTKVRVGRVDLGFFNRFIVDDVLLWDQNGHQMLRASRMSVKFDYLSLAQGRFSVSSAQLFGLRARLYRKNALSPLNFQFVIDSLASKKPSQQSRLDLSIHSLIVRHGEIIYDQLDKTRKPVFDSYHLSVSGLSGHIVLNTLTNDSANVVVKNLRFREHSGFTLKKLTFRFQANRQNAKLSEVELRLPQTHLRIPDILASYRFEGKKLSLQSLHYQGNISDSQISLSDLSAYSRTLSRYSNPLKLNIAFQGSGTDVAVRRLLISSTKGDLSLSANFSISHLDAVPRWKIPAFDVYANIASLRKEFKVIPSGDYPGFVKLTGAASGFGRDLHANCNLSSDVGTLRINFNKHDTLFGIKASTPGINLQSLLSNEKLGLVAGTVALNGTLKGCHPSKIDVTGLVSQFDYNSYNYRNIHLKVEADRMASLRTMLLKGESTIDDPNLRAQVSGTASLSPGGSKAFSLQVRHINPSALHLSGKWPGQTFSFRADANLTGSRIENMNGTLNLTDFIQSQDGTPLYTLSGLHLTAANANGRHSLEMKSDFGFLSVNGIFDYRTLLQSVMGIILRKLPGLRAVAPSLARLGTTINSRNRFNIDADIHNTDFLRHIFHIPLTVTKPAVLKGNLDEKTHHIDLTLSLPDVDYNGKRYSNGALRIYTPNDSLLLSLRLRHMDGNTEGTAYSLKASAAENRLLSSLSFHSTGSEHPLHGSLVASTQFFRKPDGITAAELSFLPSAITVGDSIWEVQPSNVVYSKNDITVNNFEISHGDQHIIADGRATSNSKDSIFVDLKDIDVAYVLNLVDFHSVDFGGKASGRAFVAGVFHKPQAAASLRVNDFTFEGGRMGWLDAKVNWDQTGKQINIDATANDTIGSGLQAHYGRRTDIVGYVSPGRNSIDLGFTLHNSRLEFVQSLCSSFMNRMDASARGNLRLSGSLSNMNLTGSAVADGVVGIEPLATTYTLHNASIRLVPDEIIFNSDTLRDEKGNKGLLTGSIHHKHLTNMSYDLKVHANNLLCYDQKTFGDNTFCGTVFATGDCTISGRSGEVDINVNVTPQRGSTFIYNTTTPGAVGSQDFISWTSRDSVRTAASTDSLSRPTLLDDIPTDIHINFVINCTPEATLKVITDGQTGDYIALEGDGTLRAAYFNKGAFNMFGNYVVDHGIYKLTIQHVIKKDFQFGQGGTIAFGGNPYEAALNLKAQYTVNGVSLADLNIGRSFSSSNTRVDCIMNITGTPATPKVEFSLDLPTVNSNAKQMIYSLINSEEEMNQQVLYLLAVGQFYSMGNNNQSLEGAARQSQTSLAMQSILSGTLSQQLNNVLSTVVNNTNWNFGANISTGNEGFYNAEYEGLLSGRMLNNRLVFNGQFGYRDNANATTSFIGDFDLRYLLLPNGNLAIKVYNQTNDRYFTRNSLTTQGIGLIMKKDFSGWRDLFGLKKKTNKKKSKVQNKRETK